MSENKTDDVIAEHRVREHVTVSVTLTVTHSVWVKLQGDTGQTMEQLKAAALAEFHRDPTKHGAYGTVTRTDDAWRMQFRNRSNIQVGSEQVSIAAVEVKPS
jgi:hypothetical protein